MSLQGELRRWSKFFRSTRITLHAKLMREIARVNVCAEMAALGGFFAHATVRVCVRVRASFLPLAFDYFFPPPPLLSLPPPSPLYLLPVLMERRGKKTKKKLLVCVCVQILERGWCCALVCLIGQILRSLRDYAWMFCV